MDIFWFLSSSMTVNWLSLGCGQNKTFEDIVLGFGKHWLIFFTIFIDRKHPKSLVAALFKMYLIVTVDEHAALLWLPVLQDHSVCQQDVNQWLDDRDRYQVSKQNGTDRQSSRYFTLRRRRRRQRRRNFKQDRHKRERDLIGKKN